MKWLNWLIEKLKKNYIYYKEKESFLRVSFLKKIDAYSESVKEIVLN